MRRRRPCRAERSDDLIYVVQALRFDMIEKGEAEPMNDREEWYLRLLNDGARVRRDDFILSRPLYLLERALAERDEP